MNRWDWLKVVGGVVEAQQSPGAVESQVGRSWTDIANEMHIADAALADDVRGIKNTLTQLAKRCSMLEEEVDDLTGRLIEVASRI